VVGGGGGGGGVGGGGGGCEADRGGGGEAPLRYACEAKDFLSCIAWKGENGGNQ